MSHVILKLYPNHQLTNRRENYPTSGGGGGVGESGSANPLALSHTLSRAAERRPPADTETVSR